MFSCCLSSVSLDKPQYHVTLNRNKQVERMDFWVDISLNMPRVKLCMPHSVLYMYSVFAVYCMCAACYNSFPVLYFHRSPGQAFVLGFFCVLRLRQGLCPSKGPRPLTSSSPHHAVYKPRSSQTVLLLSAPLIWCKHLPRLRLLEPLRLWMSKMPW